MKVFSKSKKRILITTGVAILLLVGLGTFYLVGLDRDTENSIDRAKSAISAALDEINSKPKLESVDIHQVRDVVTLELNEICHEREASIFPLIFTNIEKCHRSKTYLEDFLQKTQTLAGIVDYQAKLATLIPSFDENRSIGDTYSDWISATEAIKNIQVDEGLAVVQAKFAALSSAYTDEWGLLIDADTRHNVGHFNKAKEDLSATYALMVAAANDVKTLLATATLAFDKSLGEYLSN